MRLTGQEHFVAHLLLMKAFPENKKLAHAAWAMTRKSRFVAGRSGGRAYSWLRAHYAEMMRRRMTGNKPSAETLRKRSASAKRNVIPEPQRKKMLANMMEARKSPAYIERASLAMKQKWQDADFRAKTIAAVSKSSDKRSEALRRRWSDPDYRAKMTEIFVSNNIGRNVSDETRAKMSNARKGRSIPPETREKMRQAALAWRKAKREAAA